MDSPNSQFEQSRKSEQLTDDEKIRAFLRDKGVTKCAPIGTDSFSSPAGIGRTKSRGATASLDETYGAMPETRLARAKLITMFLDLAGKGRSVESLDREFLRHQAHHWFFSRHSDCSQWCEAAGYLPDVVREAATKVWEKKINDRIWRVAPPGTGKDYAKRKAKRNQGKGIDP